ncbi:jerky protein homolog-like [Colletes gigas]|uniref:jerky protein homolog-like n=1 Tax=Colletes gigas TaxID=935657 RepID=UPI001C9BB37F|nr:jerky protein homolog-like [Colletes gigas]
MLAGRKKSRVCLSLQQRLDILRQLNDGVSMTQLATEYKISDSTIRRIKKQELQIHSRLQTPRDKDKKRFRKPPLKELEDRLFEWYQEQKAIDDGVTNIMLQEKAVELNKEFGGPPTFHASQGWVWRFKQRRSISFRDYSTENANVDSRIAQNITHCFLQRLKEEGIELQNVYSMDETGLAWKALPRKTLMHPLARRVYGKRIKKNLVTVGLCANAIGTHKLPPLFIHRCETPKPLRHCRDRLPVIFKAQKNARVDRNLFVDWLEKHFKPAVRKHQLETDTRGKVLLLIDQCRAHTLPPQTQLDDDNVSVEYLPTDTSSNLHPMRQGIIKSMKLSFRRRILSRILDFPGGVAEFYADYDVKDCIDLVGEAWRDVTQIDIYNSWKKLAGFTAIIGEEPVEVQDSEQPSDDSDIIVMKNIIKTIVNEAVSDKEVEKWLSICEKAERDPDDSELEEEDCPDKKTILHRDEDEIDRTISKLILWSERQSEFVKLHARLVKDYYDLVQR